MNEKFKKLLKERNKTPYAVSRESGIPYTTINELVNEKTNINKCSSETVFLLTLYFKCSMEDILNDFSLIDGVSGKYRGVKYYWKYNAINKMELHVVQGEEDIIIDKGGSFTQPRFYKENSRMTELLIDYYLEELEAERMLYG